MRKLLFVVNVDWFFVSHRLPIALAAIRNGFEVHLACAVTDKKEFLEKHGVIVHPLRISRSGVGMLSELKTIAKIFAVIKSVRPDITHCVTIKPVLYGNIAARLLRVPIRVSSISGLGYAFIVDGIKGKVLRRIISTLYKFALKGSQAIIFQNKSDRDILFGMGAVKPEQEKFIRGSGVNLDEYQFVKEPTGNPVVMLVARMLIDKGVNEFAQAAKIISTRRSDVRMVLVGDVDLGNPKSILPSEIEDWVSQGILEHWGYSKDVASTLAKCNIAVLPSYREGLPKSLIEAAACGRAVVTTDVPGCRDAIEPNQTGLLVPVKSADLLANAILKLVDDGALRYDFALNGRLLAESAFDINDVITTHIDIYMQRETSL